MFRALKSLIAGVVAGTALGVLFSPKKGTEIRKEIKKEIKSGGTGLNAVKGTLTEMGKDVKETVGESQTYKKGVAKAKVYANEAKKSAEKYIDKNLNSKQKKQVKKAVSKAGVVAKKARAQAKKAIHSAAKKIADNT